MTRRSWSTSFVTRFPGSPRRREAEEQIKALEQAKALDPAFGLN
jgi:hypothetical protein